MFKNILILGHSNIGDVCYDLAVVRPLRRGYPGAKLSLLTSSNTQDLVRGFAGIDEIFIFDKHTHHKKFLQLVKLIRHLRAKKFDLAVVLKKSLFFYFLGISKVWTLKGAYASRKSVPAVDSYLDLLRSHGVKIEETAEFNFSFSQDELRSADTFLTGHNIRAQETVVSIGPFANWSLKCWPLQQWNELINILTSEFNLKVLIIGKTGHDRYSQELARRLSGEAISAVNQCSLKESMALIKRSKLFISSDTSLLHIASCMRVPCLGLYGPTATVRYYPYFHRQQVIVAVSLPSCAPCLKTRHFGRCKQEGKAPCMQAISVEEVLGKVRSLLGIGV
jgi:ADP-heptose:LPS heptosyltransferase